MNYFWHLRHNYDLCIYDMEFISITVCDYFTIALVPVTFLWTLSPLLWSHLTLVKLCFTSVALTPVTCDSPLWPLFNFWPTFDPCDLFYQLCGSLSSIWPDYYPLWPLFDLCDMCFISYSLKMFQKTLVKMKRPMMLLKRPSLS